MKPFTTLAALIFLVIAVAHVLRLARGWQIVVDGHAFPMWLSVAGAMVAGILAVMLLREARRPARRQEGSAGEQ